MPQEFHVLHCFNCETFQVDIVKKVPKWSCKICGEKQSVKKVYGSGTAKECRLLVQSLNEKRITQSMIPLVCEHEKDFETCANQKVGYLPRLKLPEFDDKTLGGKIKWCDLVDTSSDVKGDVQSLSDDIFEDKTADYDAFLRL